MKPTQEDARLAVSRHAARLFIERGVSATSGDDIAEAAGLSKRTVWRYFRTKESCIEPLFEASVLRFSRLLGDWPRNLSIENYLQQCLGNEQRNPEEIGDDILVARLLARLAEEPALLSAWLMSNHSSEQRLVGVIAERLQRSPKDPQVKLCAATVMAALRVVDETLCMAAVNDAQRFTMQQVIDELGRAIRLASTLPICDPLAPCAFNPMERPA